MYPLFVLDEPEKHNRSGEPAPRTPLSVIEPDLVAADLILINTSGGKDSQTMLEEVVRTARRLRIPKQKLVVVHADLGVVEWPGTRELAQEQTKHYGLRFEVVKYKNAEGEHHDLLEHILERGMWPDSQSRYCTSNFQAIPSADADDPICPGSEPTTPPQAGPAEVPDRELHGNACRGKPCSETTSQLGAEQTRQQRPARSPQLAPDLRPHQGRGVVEDQGQRSSTSLGLRPGDAPIELLLLQL